MFEIALIIAVVLAMTELLKRLGLRKNYLPVASLIMGVLAGVFYVDGNVQEQIMYGLMIGLSAAGLFDQTKIVKGDK